MTQFQSKEIHSNLSCFSDVGAQSQKVLVSFHKTVATGVEKEGVSIATAQCPSCDSTRINLVLMLKEAAHHAAIRCGQCDRFLGWQPKLENQEKRQQQQTTIAALLKSPTKLSQWEREFLQGLKAKKLSPKQQEILNRIKNEVGGQD